MEWHQKYYLVEGGDLLSLAEEYRNDYIAAFKRLSEFVKSLGGIGYKTNFNGVLYAIAFPKGEQPEGFKKPDKYGVSSPYKKSPLTEEFKEYAFPNPTEYIDRILDIPTGLAYYKEDVIQGSTCIGHPFQPYGFYWYSTKGPMLLTVPDLQKYAKEILREYEEIEFENNDNEWSLDDPGVREILPEEWELMKAKYERDKENVG